MFVTGLLIPGIPAQSTPNPPSNLAVTAVSSIQLDLAWNDNALDETGFRIERSSDNVTFAFLATVAANDPTFSSTGLDAAIKYYYRVLAFNVTGDSDFSNTASSTTLTPFANWQQVHFSAAQLADPNISGLNANPDDDASDNQTEFMFFGDPLQADAPPFPSALGIEQDAGDLLDHLTVTIDRDKLAIDLTLDAEVSGDLGSWQSGGGSVIGPIFVGEDALAITEKFRDATDANLASQRFMRLLVKYTGVPDSWTTGPSMPLELNEVACGVLGNRLFIIGGFNSETLAFNLDTGSWDPASTWAGRSFPGNHHTVEVFNGKLYVFGGLGSASEGKVQIFDPGTNMWSAGTDIPFLTGAATSAVIGGFIYVAGGREGLPGSRVTTDKSARYDPVANTWIMRASMPQARHHAAGETDGTKFYVFGGRFSSIEGFDEVQIYDPASNTWVSSADAGSPILPLPTPRSGMGTAVFHNGEFYVIGGESRDQAGTTPDEVFPQVEIYDPAANTWRSGTPMATPRHGIFPLLHQDRIYVASGGTVVGGGATGRSAILEIYIPGT